jgi:hypothetical protein
MSKEVFIVKNISESPVELKDFGLIIPSGVTTDLYDYYKSIASDELYNFISGGTLIRVIEGTEITNIEQAYANDTTIYNIPSFYNELNVAKSGSTFTTITDALNYISGNTNENRFVINVNSGIYIENVTLKPFVTIKGMSNCSTIIEGLIIVGSNVASHQKTRVENIGIRNSESFNTTINTDGIVEFKNCFLESFYTSDSILNSVIKLEKGNVYFSTSVINLYNTTLDSASENTDTIFYINNNNIVNFYVDNLVTNIYTYDNNNKLLLAFNTNSYSGSTFSYKDIQHNIFLYNLSSNNLITSIYNSGCSNSTIVQDMNINLNVDSTTENAKIMFAYSTQSIGLSKIKITNVNLNVVKGVIADSHFYIGASTHTNDRIYINNSNVSLTSDILPNIYTVNGNSGLTYYFISNSFGSSFSNNTITESYENQIINKKYLTQVISNLSGSSSGETTSLSTAISTEISIRNSSDISLTTAISGVSLSDTSLSTAISTETSLRSSADGSLMTAISGVTLSDTSLSTAISVESSIRGSSDISLSTVISSNITGITSLSSAVLTTNSTVVSADSSLSIAVSTETSIRSSADSSLSTAITTVTGNTVSLSTAVSTEISIRSSADSSLSTTISTEISTRSNIDSSLSTAISVETSIRSSADSSLSTAITNNSVTGITSLSTAISVETSIRSSADSSLSTAVLNHTHTTSFITDLATYSGFTNYYTQSTTNTLLNNKLSLSGGTMTGNLLFSNSLDMVIGRTTQTGSLYLYGGDSEAGGAYFKITGSGYTNSPYGSSAEFVIGNQLNSQFTLFSYDGVSTWTPRLSVSGNNGLVGISNNLSITGSTFLGDITSGVTQQNFVVIDSSTKKLATSNIKFNVYGGEFQYAQDLTTTTTTSVTPTYSTKVSITTGTLPIGTYRITASYAMNKNVTNSDLLQRVQVDGTTLGNIHNYEVSDGSSWIYSTRVMFITFATATTHTITLQFSQEAAGTLSMRDSTLEIIRTS